MVNSGGFKGFSGWREYCEEYIIVLWQISVMLLLYQVSRLGFFFYNQDIIGNIPTERLLYMMLGGIKFDLAGLMYVNIVFLILNIIPLKFRANRIYQLISKTIYFLFNAIGLSANCINLVYFRFTMRQTTASVFQEFSNEGQMGGLFIKMIFDYWPVFLLWLGSVIAMVILYNFPKRLPKAKINNWLYYPVNLVLFLLFMALIMAAIRGDLKHSTRPMTLSNAGQFTERPIEMTIVLNTPFSIIRTLNKPTLELKDYYKTEGAENIASPIHKGSGKPMDKHPNIVIFILESFGRDLSGALNKDLDNGNYEGYMPFLDSLMKEGRSYKYGFANGRKSIDALPSIICGIPDFGINYVLSHYVNDSLKGLPALLEEEGYYTAFFHGAPNGSMGLDAIANLAGFSNYFGMDEYNNDDDFDGYWGIWDEPFLQYFADKMHTFKEPFMTTVFTLSSHHPFQPPSGYEGRFREGPIPLDRVAQYTDNSLRLFFDKAKDMPWFNNTIFVFTADHSSEVNNIEYKNILGNYSVPIVFYQPGDDKFNTGIDTTRVVQHIDIMPSLLSYLEYPKDFFAFGKNIFDQQTPNHVWYYSGSWNLATDKYILQFDGGKSIGLYEHKKDRMLQNNIVLEHNVVADSLTQIIKAQIQTYNHRIISNQLTPNLIQ
jgi:phosphoglycerol transferase MdoB-like AlkP superfamily enzyme